MNLISELFNEHVSSLPHKNTDPTFMHAWSEKKHVIRGAYKLKRNLNRNTCNSILEQLYVYVKSLLTNHDCGKALFCQFTFSEYTPRF